MGAAGGRSAAIAACDPTSAASETLANNNFFILTTPHSPRATILQNAVAVVAVEPQPALFFGRFPNPRNSRKIDLRVHGFRSKCVSSCVQAPVVGSCSAGC